MVLMGCRPKGRLTEQHDIFFGIATSLAELVPAMKEAWPEAKGVLHLDAWRTVTQIDGYAVEVREKQNGEQQSPVKLFFINLGGYKEGEFDEFHYKMILAAENKGEAVSKSKQTAFYKHMGFKSATSLAATSHIDDKYGVAVDDFHEIQDILSTTFREKYQLVITKKEGAEDPLHIGYYKIDKLKEDY